MTIHINEEKKEFYERCSVILDIEHDWNPPVARRTRWNNRNEGNGKFRGYGLIQCFGAQGVRVITKSHGCRMFASYDEVYKMLEGESLCK